MSKKKKQGTKEERHRIIKMFFYESIGIEIEIDSKLDFIYSKFNYMELCNPLIMCLTFKGMNHIQIANKIGVSERRVKYVKYEI